MHRNVFRNDDGYPFQPGSSGDVGNPTQAALDAIAQRYGFGESANDAPPFARLFPSVDNATSAVALPNMVAAPGKVVEVGFRAFTLSLDPEFTTPGARVAVEFQKGGTRYTMGPGDTLEVPGGFTRFYPYDGHEASRDAIGDLFDTDPFGFVCWLAGRSPGSRPNFSNKGPRPAVSVLTRGIVSLDNSLDVDGPNMAGSFEHPWIITAGLRGFRVYVKPLDVNGAPMAAPSNFTATLQPWVCTADRNVGSDPESWGADGGVGFEHDETQQKWYPGANGNLVVTHYQRVFDVEAPNGALGITWSLAAAITGTNVISVYIVVEGY